MLEVPGVAGVGGIRICERGGGGLADHDGAGCPQTCHDRRVGPGFPVCKRGRAGGGHHSRHVEDVLHPHRNAVQGTAEPPGSGLGFHDTGRLQGAGAVDVHPGADSRLQLINAGQVSVQHRYR